MMYIDGGVFMIIQNVTNFRKDVFHILDQVTEYDDVAAITTKKGKTAMILSKDDYDSLLETLHVYEHPDVYHDLLEAKNAPDSEFVAEDEVKW